MDNPMAAWMSLQKAWIDTLTGSGPAAPVAPNPTDPFTAWYRAMGVGRTPSWPAAGPMDHVLNVFGAYNRLYEAWTRAAAAAGQGDATAQAEQIFAAWREIVEDLAGKTAGMFTFGVSDMSRNAGLDPSAFAEQMIGSVDAYREFYEDFFKPWQESMSKLSRRMLDATSGEISPEAVEEFHEAWTEAYEETVGRFVKIPNVGPTRQRHELFLKMVDAMFRWQGTTIEFSMQMQLPGRRAFEAISDKLPRLTTADATKEDFYEFYDALIGELEKHTLEFFKSQRFTKAMQSTLSTSLELYQLAQKLMEDQLRSTPIVTRSEMDEVEAELMALKRTVRKQQRELREIRNGSEPARRNKR